MPETVASTRHQSDRSRYESSRSSGASSRMRKPQRRLAAILTADIAGYSALMGLAEEETHRRAGDEIARMRHFVERYSGCVFSVAGDGLLAEFPSAVEAVKCGLRFQSDSRRRNARVSPDRRLVFRIGIHSGEIIVQDDRIGGTAVNVAARLEALAEVGGLLISGAVYDQVRQCLPSVFEPLGEEAPEEYPGSGAALRGAPRALCRLGRPPDPAAARDPRARLQPAHAGGPALPHAAPRSVRPLFRRLHERRDRSASSAASRTCWSSRAVPWRVSPAPRWTSAAPSTTSTPITSCMAACAGTGRRCGSRSNWRGATAWSGPTVSTGPSTRSSISRPRSPSRSVPSWPLISGCANSPAPTASGPKTSPPSTSPSRR